MADAQPDVPDGVVDELLSAGADEFVSTRSAIAKRLRAEGDRDAAAAVGKLRKPTRLVWILDRSAREQPAAMQRLVDAVRAARQAQAAGRGGDLRAASTEMRQAIGELAGGDPEAAQALRVVAGDEGSLDALAAGRLLALPELGGMGPLPERADPTSRGAPSAPSRKTDARARRAAKDALRSAERELDKAERALRRARTQLEELEREVAAREHDVEAATAGVEEAKRQLDELDA